MPQIRRFVILSGSRSGTSLLSETLNSHPMIVCHGEVFHPTPAGHIKISSNEISTDSLIKLRESSQNSFIDLIFNRPGVQAVGFKMWRSQNEDVCYRLMEDKTVFKIIYERTNVLARLASSRLVKVTGIYNLSRGRDRPKHLMAEIGFNKKAFLQYAQSHRDMFAAYRKRSKGATLDVTYKSIMDNGYNEVLSFLGVEETPLTNKKQKLHGSSILGRFRKEDHDIVVQTMKEQGDISWLHE